MPYSFRDWLAPYFLSLTYRPRPGLELAETVYPLQDAAKLDILGFQPVVCLPCAGSIQHSYLLAQPTALYQIAELVPAIQTRRIDTRPSRAHPFVIAERLANSNSELALH